MLAPKTLQGLAPPAQINARPSGRYSLRVPDAPIGSVLRVTTREGSTRFVQKVSDVMFLDVTGAEVDFVDWDFATRADVAGFLLERRLEQYADAVELHGAPAFAASIRGLPRLERDSVLCATADILRERHRDGKASQVLAYRFVEEG